MWIPRISIGNHCSNLFVLFFFANYLFSASKIQRVMEISNLVGWLQTPPLLNHTYTHVLVANLTSYFILFWISPKSSVNKNSPTMATVSGFEHCQETHRLKTCNVNSESLE